MTLVSTQKTKKALLDLIKYKGALSLTEAVRHIKLTKATVRQHLLQMEEQKLVVRSYKKLDRGRPELSFRLTNLGHSTYPNQEQRLLSDLVEFLAANDRQQTLVKFFKNYWSGRYESFEEIMERKGKGAMHREIRVKTLVEFLQADRFMPRLESVGPGEVKLRECNCPFQSIVTKTRLPCEFESKFIAKALRCRVKRTEHLLDGADSCAYTIERDHNEQSH